MPRLFNRLITFKITGEIYDTETKPEDILRGYTWKTGVCSDDSVSITADHHDRRGKITTVVKLPKLQKTSKPDSEYFLI